jgi:transcriptional regulator with GAF, ATPase, and Fis domain
MDPKRGSGAQPPTVTADERPAVLPGYSLLVCVPHRKVEARAIPPFGSLVVGRDPACDVQVDDHAVSRQHFVVRGGEPPSVEDLGSRNGTRVRGRRLERGDVCPVGIGHVVEVGPAAFIVQRSGAVVRDGARPGRASPAPPSLEPPPGVIVRDRTMQKLYRLLDTVAQGTLSVLILGETGVGKEVYAATLHARSPRASRRYLSINCAAMPEAMLEGELFGYERGAFTGAVAAKAGLFEACDGGTVFLDELGELTPATQMKLLRVLENGEVMRLGSLTPKRVDIRFVCATNRDVESDVRDGRFRADLFFRVNGVSVTIPPLRERPDDIEALAERFFEQSRAKLGRSPVELAPEARAALRGYAWPGNVRELRNVVERAALLCESERIEEGHLGLRAPAKSASSLKAGVNREEREMIVQALTKCAGNQTLAAKLLGVSRRTLVAKLALHGIPRPRRQD